MRFLVCRIVKRGICGSRSWDWWELRQRIILGRNGVVSSSIGRVECVRVCMAMAVAIQDLGRRPAYGIHGESWDAGKLEIKAKRLKSKIKLKEAHDL